MQTKPILIIPMMGVSQRFIDAGYTIPKPLIMVENCHIIDMAMSSIILGEYERIIFVVRTENIYDYSIDTVLKNKFPSCEILNLDGDTSGSLETCTICIEQLGLLNSDNPLVIYTPDVYFSPIFSTSSIDEDLSGFVLTFKANSPNHSYIRTEGRNVVEIAEKRVISNDACVGIYYFDKISLFYKKARIMINNNDKYKEEFYISPVFNYIINDGLLVGYKSIDKMHVLGTPSELSFFCDKSLQHLKAIDKKCIGLVADHSGYDLKEQVKKWLETKDINFIDFGTYANKSCDYADFVLQATGAIYNKTVDLCFGFCRTGQGINICANKQKHILSALVFDDYTAKYSVKHNCANFFSIPSKYVDMIIFKDMFVSINNNSFDSGRHMTRLMKIDNE